MFEDLTPYSKRTQLLNAIEDRTVWKKYSVFSAEREIENTLAMLNEEGIISKKLATESLMDVSYRTLNTDMIIKLVDAGADPTPLFEDFDLLFHHYRGRHLDEHNDYIAKHGTSSLDNQTIICQGQNQPKKHIQKEVVRLLRFMKERFGFDINSNEVNGFKYHDAIFLNSFCVQAPVETDHPSINLFADLAQILVFEGADFYKTNTISSQRTFTLISNTVNRKVTEEAVNQALEQVEVERSEKRKAEVDDILGLHECEQGLGMNR